MKGDVYYGKGIRELKDSHPDLFDLVSNINETVWDGKVLDYKTQKLIAIGITALISVQAFVNIGVVTSLLPNTGIPLPFISSGLTALLCNLATIGILLNISLQPKEIEKDRVIELTDYGMVR